MKKNTIAFRHFGCRLNLFETTALETEFLAQGFVKEKAQKADWIVVNTCAVTKRAEEKNRQAIRKLQRENPNAKIVLTGCYASRQGEKLSQMAGVHSVVENGQKAHLVSLLESQCKTDGISVQEREPLKEDNRFKFSYHQKPSQARAYLKIQDGCDRKCSYCQIPFSRGRGVSRPLTEIKTELKKILGFGFKEVVLTGVNIGDYFWSESGKSVPVIGYGLFELLDELSSLVAFEQESGSENKDWYFRLSSLEPDTISEKILSLYRSQKLAAFLHAPLQNGSDKILTYMQRDYNTTLFKEKTQMVLSTFPQVRVSSDVIVGFPGESEEDFVQTCRLIEECSLSGLHVFPFSPREGTSIAEIMRKQQLTMPSSMLSAERSKELYDLEKKLSARYLQNNKGNVFRAIYQKEKNSGDGSFLSENNFAISSSSLSNVSPEALKVLRHGQMVFLENNVYNWRFLQIAPSIPA